jgi:hypothetical protein
MRQHELTVRVFPTLNIRRVGGRVNEGFGKRATGRTCTDRAPVGLGPTDPAFSRNPKPPPLGGGEFTKAVMRGQAFASARVGAAQVDPA